MEGGLTIPQRVGVVVNLMRLVIVTIILLGIVTITRITPRTRTKARQTHHQTTRVRTIQTIGTVVREDVFSVINQDTMQGIVEVRVPWRF